MIVDCHTHLWTSRRQLGPGAEEYIRRQDGREDAAAGPAAHEAAAACTDKTLVLGFVSRHLGAAVPNDLIADYVAGHGDRMVGIAAVDPTEEAAMDKAVGLLERPEFRGLTISPAMQNYHPADSRAMALYELASERRVPLFFQQGTHFPSRGRMEYARPLLLDEIALEHPDLPLVVASMGHPWIEECIALVGKHAGVYTDIAGLIRRPWQAYNALVLAHQFNVMDKVLFASDFPFFTAAEAIESVYRMHEMAQGTNLPTVPREQLRSVVERDALAVLGVATPGERSVPEPAEPVQAEAEEEGF
jgi:hypothetical protein